MGKKQIPAAAARQRRVNRTMANGVNRLGQGEYGLIILSPRLDFFEF
jgi:hypothetical protein